MGSAILRESCFREGSVERRGTRDESYQTDLLKISAARLWTLDSRPLPPQPSTPLALPQPSTLDSRPSTPLALPKHSTARHWTLDSSSGLREGEFYAVKNVSFELRRHQCLGLIGHNGAGKTTLLKMLNGLIKPDAGSITMRGRVGALIALGAGFNPILTGASGICFGFHRLKREPEGWPPARSRVLRLGEEARGTSKRRLACRVQRWRRGEARRTTGRKLA